MPFDLSLVFLLKYLSLFRRPDCSIGDFSFALSLVEHHQCKFVTATCYDSEEVLHQKYPQTRAILEKLLGHTERDGSRHKQSLEPANSETLIHEETKVQNSESCERTSEWEGFSPSPLSEEGQHRTTSSPTSINESSHRSLRSSVNGEISFHASISAIKMPSHKAIRRTAPFNKIVFNFPHVGGLSTDINRQVRANQELLVAFFKSCKPLLASKFNPVQPRQSVALHESFPEEEDDDLMHDENQDQEDAEDRSSSGQVIISLFDGEPYSLWNIRDLARHSGFKVITSWRFPWDAYPGYRHARTLGKIVPRNNGVSAGHEDDVENKKRAAWKGEEREARGFVFEVIVEDRGRPRVLTKERTPSQVQMKQGPRNKRGRSTSSSDHDA